MCIRDRLSALQYAYDWKIRDEAAFNAEAQQNPDHTDRFAQTLSVTDIASKVNRRPRGVLPFNATTVSGFIDVQGDSLWWLVLASGEGFTGSIIDYGVYPEQPGDMWYKGKLRRALIPALKADSIEAALHRGLTDLTNKLCGRDWIIEGTNETAVARMSRLMIDANWPVSTQIVYEVCRQSPFAAVMTPSHGHTMTAAQRPYSEHSKAPGQKIGNEWKLVRDPKKRPIPYCLIDTNYWKTFAFSRLATQPGGRGGFDLFGDDPKKHILLAQHFTSEYRVETEGRGRKVDQWNLPTDRPDNDWWDCLVGACVAASIEGVALEEHDTKTESETDYSKRRWDQFLARAKRR